MAQKPDPTTAKDAGGGFSPHSEGQHAMVCVDVVNLGKKVEQFGDQEPREVEKVALVFASGETQDGDKSLTVVTVEMTNSMNEKANLRKFLESWRGKSYTAEQAEAGVPLHKLQGNAALVSIEHVTTSRQRKFAKVRSVSPLPKAMTAPNSSVLESYERPKFLDDKKVEYARGLAKHRAEVQSQPDESFEDYPAALEDEEDDENSLPF